ncbi:MAG TPA: hypothetical protein DEG06_02305 [Lachnospiraceae bacterium]|nr:hypothetical protein [Lachnospiraceae bacterium]
MKSCELVAFITAAACKINECFPPEEVSLLAAAFTQLGDTLATLIASEELCDKKTESAAKDTNNQDESANQFACHE